MNIYICNALNDSQLAYNVLNMSLATKAIIQLSYRWLYDVFVSPAHVPDVR